VKLLLVAPEVCSPWTEGRRNLVRDLVEDAPSDYDIRLLTTTHDDGATLPDGAMRASTVRFPAAGLVSLARNLAGELGSMQPDIVIHFPYGTFRGIRGIANRVIVRSIARRCERRGIPCVTALYSLDAAPGGWGFFDDVPGRVVAGAGGVWNGKTVEYGLSTRGWPEVGTRDLASRSLLYLAGMWQPNQKRFDHIINLRGLGVLLQAGREIEAAGATLTVAAPIFDSPEWVQRLHDHPANTWSSDALHVKGRVDDIPGVLLDHSLLVFSYQDDIPVFRPTSVMEAMALGTVPLLSDLPFLRASFGEAAAPAWFKHNDPSALAAAVTDAFGDLDALHKRSRAAQAYAKERWSIAATLAGLVEAAR